MANIQPVPTGALKSEPAISIGGSVSGVLLATFLVLKSFGVPITDDMSNSLNALVVALCAFPAISGWITRNFVFSPASTQAIANEVAKTQDASIPPPPANDAS